MSLLPLFSLFYYSSVCLSSYLSEFISLSPSLFIFISHVLTLSFYLHLSSFLPSALPFFLSFLLPYLQPNTLEPTFLHTTPSFLSPVTLFHFLPISISSYLTFSLSLNLPSIAFSMPISSPSQTYLLDPTGTSGLPVGPDICIGRRTTCHKFISILLLLSLPPPLSLHLYLYLSLHLSHTLST